jgi:hypothetical protein
MLGYQKSSPAHSLDEKTAADNGVFLKRLAQVSCVNVALVRSKIFLSNDVVCVWRGGQRFLVLQHEAAAVPHAHDLSRRKQP